MSRFAPKNNLCRVVVAAGFASLVQSVAGSSIGSAKTPGAEYCFRGWCHRVSTIDEMDGSVGRRGYLTASYYDHCSRDRFNTCGLTSSGAIFHADEPDNAASPIFPDGTIILAYNPANNSAAVLRVTSAGPYHGDRKLDVSRGAAEKLGFIKSGVAQLIVSVLKSPNAQDARYKKLRTYEKVPGPIGKFQTFDEAEQVALAKLAMQANIAVASESRSSVSAPDTVAMVESKTAVETAVPPIAGMPAISATQPTPAVLQPPLSIGEVKLPVEQIALTESLSTVAARETTFAQNLNIRFIAFVERARQAARPEFASNDARVSGYDANGATSFYDRFKNFVQDARQQAKPQSVLQSDSMADMTDY